MGGEPQKVGVGQLVMSYNLSPECLHGFGEWNVILPEAMRGMACVGSQ